MLLEYLIQVTIVSTIALVSYFGHRYKFSVLLSPPFFFSIITLVSIHLSAVLIDLGVEWRTPRLAEEEVSQVLRFSTLAVIFYFLGFRAVKVKNTIKPSYHYDQESKKRLTNANLLEGISKGKLLEILIPVVVLSILVVLIQSPGGNPFSDAGMSRFDLAEYGTLENNPIINIARVILLPLGMVSAAVLAAYASKTRNITPYIIGFALVVLISLPQISKFSRGAGGFVVIYAITYSILMDKRRFFVTAITISFGIYLSLIGFFARGISAPGFHNFIDLFLRPIDVVNYYSIGYLSIRHPLDALEISTVFIRANTYIALDTWLAVKHILMQFSPIPSFIQGISRPYIGVVEFLGATNIGLPNPSMAEVFVVLGWIGGSIFYFLVGTANAWMIRFVPMLGFGVLSVQMMVLAIDLGFVIGVHQGLRGLSRPSVLLLTCLVVVSTVQQISRKRSLTR